jgi:ribosomal protein S18 acetylase RimI-like enzyme
MDFKFTNNYPLSKVDEIVSYLLGPRLWIPNTDYPDFLDWAQKVHGELKKEVKRALIALYENNIVGVVIYQRHKKYKDALEIKNLTVRPDMRGRFIASFLMRNAEIEGQREFNSRYVLCDAKANNHQVRLFLMKHHYRIVRREDLYGLNSGDDIVYRKDLVSLCLANPMEVRANK